MKKSTVAFILVLFFISLCFLFNLSKNETDNKSNNETKLNNHENNTNEICAVWITYFELPEENFEEEIDNMFLNLSSGNVNTVFVHTRPFSKVIYNSKYFKNDSKMDKLKIICEKGKKYNLSIHAWINPYRVSNSNNYNREEFPLPDEIISTKSYSFYNPASKEASKMIINDIVDLIKHYDLKGIHIDDYFYPEDMTKDLDICNYEKYKTTNGSLDLYEWRRQNISNLLKEIYTKTKVVKPNIIISVSPNADIEKNENTYFADVKKWCSDEGYLDWIIPQIYFGYNNETKPFLTVLNSWIELNKSNKVKVIVGLAPYKIGKVDDYAGTGKNEFIDNKSVINEQITDIKELEKQGKIIGYSLYSYSSLK